MILLLLCASVVLADSRPHSYDARREGDSFTGNVSVNDHFKLLSLDGHFLLIGARDAVYNISLRTFAAEKSIVWESTEKDTSVCRMKGNSQEGCRNYVRVLAKESDGSMLVCGTNSFSPLCRIYRLDMMGEYEYMEEVAGNAICPYDPDHNSTALYVPETGELYAGTVADFAGKDPLIHRRRILGNTQELGLRTERNDIKTLNEPSFVGSLSWAGETYFWLREEAVEYGNCGKAVYSRVARVCNSDRGGPRLHSETWTSFLKARLNCSLPGSFPFYFDEIEAISGIISGVYSDVQPWEIVYAVFNTPYTAIRGSAVCAFRLADIQRVFKSSAFKSQAGPDANWKPLHPSQVPDPRPSICTSQSREMSDEAINFMISNPLMDDTIPNAFAHPVFTHTGFKDRLTQIAVDPQVTLVDGRKVDLVFLGTDKGRILKIVNVLDATEASSPVEVLQVFDTGAAVRNLVVYGGRGGGGEAALVAVSQSEVRRLPLHRCHLALDCVACVALRDPYCAWHKPTLACHARTHGEWPRGDYLQDVELGMAKCPAQDFVVELPPPEHPRTSQRLDYTFDTASARQETQECDCERPTISNSSPKALPDTAGVERRPSEGSVVTGSSLAIGVIVTLILALAIGFIAGYQCSSRQCLRRRKGVVRTPSSLSNQPNTTISLCTNGTGHTVLGRSASMTAGATIRAYEAGPRPPLSLPLSTFVQEDKNNKVPDNNPFATLPRDYRVKKIYL